MKPQELVKEYLDWVDLQSLPTLCRPCNHVCQGYPRRAAQPCQKYYMLFHLFHFWGVQLNYFPSYTGQIMFDFVSRSGDIFVHWIRHRRLTFCSNRVNCTVGTNYKTSFIQDLSQLHKLQHCWTVGPVSYSQN